MKRQVRTNRDMLRNHSHLPDKTKIEEDRGGELLELIAKQCDMPTHMTPVYTGGVTMYRVEVAFERKQKEA